MSKWLHAICDRCWQDTGPLHIPVRLKDPDPERCCFCTKQTRSGIYLRKNPNHVGCHGVGRVHDE